ncbi:MAG: RadC family protein [Bdellovibrionales bacterium]
MRITHPFHAFRFFHPRLLRAQTEEFWAAALGSDKTVLGARCLFRGTVDHCLFHPRDVFRFACLQNASALVVAHNHPGGSPRPSPQDVAVTEQLLTVALILQIPLVDHVIVARDSYYSFLENGRLRLRAKELSEQTWVGSTDPVLPNDQEPD